MEFNNVRDYLKEITPEGNHHEQYAVEYIIRKVELKNTLDETLKAHYYDEESTETYFRRLVPMKQFVRFEGKNMNDSECLIELLEPWFRNNKQVENLINSICNLINEPGIQFYVSNASKTPYFNEEIQTPLFLLSFE